MTILLKGKPVRERVFAELEETIKQTTSAGHRKPELVVILVGNDKASEIYVNNKRKACDSIGIKTTSHALPEETSETDLLALIDTLNVSTTVDGILVQLPLPAHISSEKVIERIAIHKDVDGFHPYNVGRLALRHPGLRPCTPYGIIRMLKHYHIDPTGKDVTIVGVSNIVGRPLMLEFLLARATPTACHRFTKDLKKHVARADILVSATGVRGIIDPSWINPQAVVIDVGIHRLDDGRITGDLDFEAISPNVKAITPVPGGVGPMTITVLLENTVNSYVKQVQQGK